MPDDKTAGQWLTSVLGEDVVVFPVSCDDNMRTDYAHATASMAGDQVTINATIECGAQQNDRVAVAAFLRNWADILDRG